MILSRQSKCAGFTLIELVISVALMTIVLGSAYACLSAGVSGKQLIEARGESVQSARAALNLIASDLREAIPMISTNRLPEFIGATNPETEAGNLDFATRNYTPRRPYEADWCAVSYYLEPDPQFDSFILKRRRKAIMDRNPLEGGATEEIARGVRDIWYRYYDRYGDPYDDWGDVSGQTRGMALPPENASLLPFSIRITLVMDAEKPRARARDDGRKPGEEPEPKSTLSFKTTVHLQHAEYFYQQAYANSDEGSGSQTVQQGPDEGGAQ